MKMKIGNLSEKEILNIRRQVSKRGISFRLWLFAQYNLKAYEFEWLRERTKEVEHLQEKVKIKRTLADYNRPGGNHMAFSRFDGFMVYNCITGKNVQTNGSEKAAAKACMELNDHERKNGRCGSTYLYRRVTTADFE